MLFLDIAGWRKNFVDIMFDGEGGSFGAVRHTNFRQDTADIVTNRAFAQKELDGDLAVGHAVGDEREHGKFLRREFAEGGGTLGLVGFAHFAENGGGEGRVKNILATADAFDRLNEVVVANALEDVAGSTGANGGEEQFIFRIGREHDDAATADIGDNLAAGFDAGNPGHANVEHSDVGMPFLCLADCFFAGRGFSDDVEVFVVLQQGTQPCPDNRVVVSNQNTHGI